MGQRLWACQIWVNFVGHRLKTFGPSPARLDAILAIKKPCEGHTIAGFTNQPFTGSRWRAGFMVSLTYGS